MAVPDNKDIAISLSNKVLERIKKGSDHQLRYETILSHIANVRLHKCELYGESRYEVDDPTFNYWMCFSDVHRKYIRLEQLTKIVAGSPEDEVAVSALKDAYLDIANYGIAGFQILTKDSVLEKTNDKN